MPQRIRRLSSLLAGVALLVAGCGGGSSPSGPTAGSPTATRVTIDADPSGALRWVQPRAEAKAGRVRVTLRNRSAVAHDLHVSGRGVDAGTPTIQEGSATVAVALDPVHTMAAKRWSEIRRSRAAKGVRRGGMARWAG